MKPTFLNALTLVLLMTCPALSSADDSQQIPCHPMTGSLPLPQNALPDLGELLLSNQKTSESKIKAEFIGGISNQTKPEQGTWWDPNYGTTSFSQNNFTFGLGVRGENWSVRVQDVGREFGVYHDQNGIYWRGSQTPIGVWAFWQPHLGSSLYGMIGVGADKPDFMVRGSVPDGTHIDAMNNHISPSYALGLGIKLAPNIDLNLINRYVYAYQKKGPQEVVYSNNHGSLSINVPNYGKFATTGELVITTP